jgi:hypothetical protein
MIDRMGHPQLFRMLPVFAVLFLDVIDLFDPAGMTPPFKLGLQPRIDNEEDKLITDQVSRQTQHIRIVVLTRKLSRQFIMTKRRSDTPQFVGRNGHPQARPTNQNRAIRLAFGNASPGDLGHVGIVATFGAIAPAIINLVLGVSQHFNDTLLGAITTVIARD